MLSDSAVLAYPAANRGQATNRAGRGAFSSNSLYGFTMRNSPGAPPGERLHDLGIVTPAQPIAIEANSKTSGPVKKGADREPELIAPLSKAPELMAQMGLGGAGGDVYFNVTIKSVSERYDAEWMIRYANDELAHNANQTARLLRKGR